MFDPKQATSFELWLGSHNRCGFAKRKEGCSEHYYLFTSEGIDHMELKLVEVEQAGGWQ